MATNNFKSRNKKQIEKEPAVQLKANAKAAKELDNTMTSVVKKINDYTKAAEKGSITEEEKLKLIKEQIQLYHEQTEEINYQSKALDALNKKQQATVEHRITNIKQENKAQMDSLNEQSAKLFAGNLITQSRLEIYEKEEYIQRQQLKNIRDNQELQLNILASETSTYDEKIKAQEKLNRLVTEESKIRLKEEKANKKREEARKKSEEEAKKKLDTRTKRQKITDGLKDFANAQYSSSGLMTASQLTAAGVIGKDFFAKQKEIADSDDSIKGKLGKSLGGLGDAMLRIKDTLKSLSNTIDSSITTAQQYISSAMGPVTAALEGTGKTFSDIREGLLKSVGNSPLVQQTKLLDSIQQLTSQGITTDLESLAILSAIRDKTVASFDVTNSDLRRLVRLNQNRGNLTAKQFGLAAALREQLNAYFGDSSFIAQQFQSLTGTILDAISANAQKGGTDSTAFYSLLESWAAGMYESGVDQGFINTVAQGINYLGSGNIQALSGNKALQNLMLLSMDRAGLDYATILQQGLSTSDTYELLKEIINYLASIADTTKKNNVLQSSYADLFNLSITDLTAIKNLSETGFYSSFTQMGGAQAYSETIKELNQVADERTYLAEVLTNVGENMKFNFGMGVATSKWGYPTYLFGKTFLDMIEPLPEGLMKKGLGLIGGIPYFISLLSGVDDLARGFGANIKAIGPNNTLSNFFINSGNISSGIYDNSTSMGLTIKGKGKSQLISWDSDEDVETKEKELEEQRADWERKEAEAEEDPNTKILKEFEKTLMKANEGENYAFAVSLQGMSDGVLRSFASIFADEDAMMETLTGKNNALEENNTFIDYVNDTSKKVSAGVNTAIAPVK